MDLPENSLDRSALVVAHPDDEVLWFSSILNDVTSIIVLFAGSARPERLSSHPCYDKMTWLGLQQLACHNLASWPSPEETEYGLRLDKKPERDKDYADQASRIESALDPLLAEYRNIFTHNPWGEYGHETHAQVSKVVTKLAETQGAAVWYSNYVSGKSSRLFRRYVHGFSGEYFTRPVDTARASAIADTYRENDAWTFDHDFGWFPSECFVRGPLEPVTSPAVGTLFPVNYVRVPFEPVAPRRSRPGVVTRIHRKLKRLFGPGNPARGHASSA